MDFNVSHIGERKPYSEALSRCQAKIGISVSTMLVTNVKINNPHFG
jgi:hypothetical protein